MRLSWPLLLSLTTLAGTAVSGSWDPLTNDGLHDPSSPAIGQLQEPAVALGVLPPNTTGNQVLWVEAVQIGIIQPRTNIYPETKVNVRDQDILMNRNGSMPMVRFPHKAHTLWLDCSNCHNDLFKDKIGANKFSMFKMLQGEQCGVCHGAVAFPLTECERCHNAPQPRPGAARK